MARKRLPSTELIEAGVRELGQGLVVASTISHLHKVGLVEPLRASTADHSFVLEQESSRIRRVAIECMVAVDVNSLDGHGFFISAVAMLICWSL